MASLASNFVFKNRLCLIILVIFLIFPLSVTANEKDGSSGGDIYKEYCNVCHGDKGDGKSFIRYAVKIPPPDFTNPENMKKFSIERMKRSVYYGRSATAMVAWNNILTEGQINDVLAFIRKKFMNLKDDKEKIENLHFDTTLQAMDEESEKRYLSGKAIYQQLCFQCHGINGDANVPVKGALLYPPRNFTDPAVIDTLYSSLMFYSIKDGIEGTGMPSWKFDLTDDQIVNVIVYIKKEFMKNVP